MRNEDDVTCQKWVSRLLRALLCELLMYTQACRLHHLALHANAFTKVHMLYRSEGSVAQRVLWDVGRWLVPSGVCHTCSTWTPPASRGDSFASVSRWVRDFLAFRRFPAHTSSSSCPQTPCVIRLKTTATVIIRGVIHSLPPSEIDRRVDTATTTMLSALSHGKFDNFQPFAPTRTWAQLWLMILPRQTHSASLFSCVTSYPPCTIRCY